MLNDDCNNGIEGYSVVVYLKFISEIDKMERANNFAKASTRLTNTNLSAVFGFLVM